MVAASASLAPLEVCPESMLAETLAATSSCVSPVAEAVRNGLTSTPKTLPPWLFYDHEGSLLFEEITRLPEYYLTRIERGIFLSDASEMIALAAGDDRLRLVELGAGSADKTRLLLAAANEFQGQVCYQPVDVSESALTAARLRLESELPEVIVEPQVCDYTHSLRLEPCSDDEKRLVLYIGSSIGNFLPEEAMELLCGLRAALSPGDSLLLGVDLAPTDGAKSVDSLIAAYDDAQGVTAKFNKNMLVRLNRELGSDFDLESFRHRIRWNSDHSRIEMHLESMRAQRVRIPSLDMEVEFAEGETIHTENSYKYRLGEVERILDTAGFRAPQRWRDEDGWFAVYLAERR